jgi:TolA-binding protein
MAKSQAEAPVAAETPAGADQNPIEWIQKHRRPVGAVAIVVLAIAAGSWLTVTTQARKELAAQQSLSTARAMFDAYNLPAAAAGFQEVIQGYSGTRAAKEATLALNQVRIINGQNELAIVSLRDFISGGPGAVYEVPGAGLLGAALENVNRPEEAAEAFLEAAEKASVGYLRAEYLLSAGAAFRAAGLIEEAEAAFRTIIDDLSDTPSLTEAKVRLSELTQGAYSDAPEPL